MVIDSMFETGNFSTLRDVILNLLKVVLFHSKGRGSFFITTTSAFMTNSGSPILGHSNEVSFVSESGVWPE